jgi:hypothetical protein
MTLSRYILLPIVCAVTVIEASGCATVGKQKNLGFIYRAEDAIFGTASVGLAIARGAKAELIVSAVPRRHGERKEPPPQYVPVSTAASVTLASARSSDPRVVAVAGVDRDRVSLEGRRAGEAEVTVHTASIADKIDLFVAEIHRVELDHLAGRQLLKGRFPAGAAFVKGGTARLTMTRFDEKGRHLVGHGLKPFVVVEPAGSASVSAGDGDHGHVEVRLHAAGRVRLLPKRGASLELRVVDQSEVQSLELVAWDLSKGRRPWPGSLEVQDKQLIYLRAALPDGTPVLGTDGVAAFISLTPHICRLRPASRWLGDGFFGVEALAPGECQLQVKLGARTCARGLTVRAR